jgi:hypothetical protein
MTTKVPTLAEFLTARLDDEEERALSALGGSWSHGQRDPVRGEIQSVENETVTVVVRDDEAADSDLEHIARHDPARALREIEAKRRIAQAVEEGVIDLRPDARDEVFKHLAAVYADHRDYRDEWRP